MRMLSGWSVDGVPSRRDHLVLMCNDFGNCLSCRGAKSLWLAENFGASTLSLVVIRE